MARALGIGAYLILSDSEAGSGGRSKSTILADAMEALLGAIFLDGGFDKARAAVRRLWAGQPEEMHTTARPDAKSALQEWAQGQGLALPQYVEVARKGPDHAPHFTSEVRISGAPAGARGRAIPSAPPSRRRRARCSSVKACAGRRRMSDAGEGGKDRGSVGAEAQRCGFIAVIGAPNAGKSTLVNALVGAKVSIVSRKVQTTRVPDARHRHRGREPARVHRHAGHVRAEEASRAGDGGGRLGRRPRCRHRRARRRRGQGLDEEVEGIIGKLKDVRAAAPSGAEQDRPVVGREKLLALAADLDQQLTFDRVFMISATNGDGVADLKRYLAAHVPPGPWHYPAEDLSDAPLRLLAAEITREKIFNRLHDEMPYATTVETTSWEERKDGSVRIEQTIFVARDGQKAIMLGKGGQTIKQISTESRIELAGILERPVHLFLFVKVREGWQDDPERYREMGLELPKLERPKK